VGWHKQRAAILIGKDRGVERSQQAGLIDNFVFVHSYQWPQDRARRRLLDAALAAFALVSIVGWFYFTGGRGNPFNLGYTSKVVEVILLVVLALHLRSLADTPSTTTTARRV